MATEPAEIFVRSDRPLLLAALERITSGHYRCEPISAIEKSTGPHILILDSCGQFPALPTSDFPVIVWQRSDSVEASLQALEWGAWGILHDHSPLTDILACLETVSAGRHWIPQTVTEALLEFRRFRLTPREEQITTLVANGLRNREIATQLGITEGTVKVYLSRMFDKLGVSDRHELALLGLRHFTQSGSFYKKQTPPCLCA